MAVIAKAQVAQLNGFSSITAAAELSVAFGDCFYRWKTRLLGGWGSSSAQRNGGRVRAPAPTKKKDRSEISVGAGPRPACGRTLCAPTAENGPGALARKLRRRPGTAPGANFANPGPSGPAGIEGATQILRAGNFAWTCRYASPVMGSGADSPCQGEMARRARGGRVGDYEHEVLILSRPPAILKVNCPEGAREGGLGHW